MRRACRMQLLMQRPPPAPWAASWTGRSWCGRPRRSRGQSWRQRRCSACHGTAFCPACQVAPPSCAHLWSLAGLHNLQP